MAVTLISTTPGDIGLFNTLGRIGYAIGVVNTDRGTTYPTEVEDVVEYLDGENLKLRNTVSGLPDAVDEQDRAMDLLINELRDAAENIVIEMFDADAPLDSRDIETALDALKRQMLTATTHYVDANTVSATYTGTSLTGTGNVVTSVKDGRGDNLENLIAERILLECTDATVAGSEIITARGEVPARDKLAAQWPLGSGSVASYESLASGSASNLVTNGDFEDFTANAPDNWSIIAGSAGTTIDDEASTIYEGAKALKFIGDGGGTLSHIRQAITGLESLTPYAINFTCRVSSNPAAGVLTVDLYDGSNVINDEAGTANSFTVDLTTLGTTYVHKSGVFRLPEPVPATVYLRVRLSTAITNTHTLYIDNMAMQEMAQTDANNPGGTPYVAVFGGAVNWSEDDGNPQLTNTFKIETANDRASEWQTLFDRLFNTAGRGYVLPVAGTTLVNDNLIA